MSSWRYGIISVTCVFMALWYHLCLLSETWWVRDSLFTKLFYEFCRFYRIHMSEKLDCHSPKSIDVVVKIIVLLLVLAIHLLLDRVYIPGNYTTFGFTLDLLNSVNSAKVILRKNYLFSVADPGFSQGGANPQGGGAPGYDFIKCSRKLHEIKKNLVARGGGHRGRPPPRSATGFSLCRISRTIFLISSFNFHTFFICNCKITVSRVCS